MNSQIKTANSELMMGIWSVIDAESVRGLNLTYKQARQKLTKIQKSEGQNLGLTVVTVNAAARILTSADQNEAPEVKNG